MDRTVYYRQLLAGLRDASEFVGATCTEVGGDVWFPDDGGLSRETLLAAQLCKTCPVRRSCLRMALESEDIVTRYGVWAGYTKRTLRRMRHLRALLACPPSKQGVTSLPTPTDEGAPDVAA